MQVSSQNMRITDAILLAAGSSSRMGIPKQLLRLEHTTLLNKSISVLKSCTPIRNIIVVIGANASQVIQSFPDEPIDYIIAQNWESGMGASLKIGMASAALWKPEADQILITVCDQPYLNLDILTEIIKRGEKGKITVADYGNEIGTPALFDKIFFQELKELPDDTGARKLFGTHKNKLISVPFPEGLIDLDTPEDYENFLKTDKNLK